VEAKFSRNFFMNLHKIFDCKKLIWLKLGLKNLIWPKKRQKIEKMTFLKMKKKCGKFLNNK